MTAVFDDIGGWTRSDVMHAHDASLMIKLRYATLNDDILFSRWNRCTIEARMGRRIVATHASQLLRHNAILHYIDVK